MKPDSDNKRIPRKSIFNKFSHFVLDLFVTDFLQPNLSDQELESVRETTHNGVTLYAGSMLRMMDEKGWLEKDKTLEKDMIQSPITYTTKAKPPTR